MMTNYGNAIGTQRTLRVGAVSTRAGTTVGTDSCSNGLAGRAWVHVATAPLPVVPVVERPVSPCTRRDGAVVSLDDASGT
jgi:hypothetical protein